MRQLEHPVSIRIPLQEVVESHIGARVRYQLWLHLSESAQQVLPIAVSRALEMGVYET